jgi:hypothetical protein
MENSNTLENSSPIINLAGTDFFVDAYKMELIEVANPANSIHALEMMSLDDHLELFYDKTVKNVFLGRWDLPQDADKVQHYWLRPFGAVDPIGMERGMNESNPDWRKYYPENWPVIEIAGTDFYVDEPRNAFRQVNNCWNLISFKEVEQADGYAGFYLDTRINNVPFPHEFDAKSQKGHLPEHIVWAAVPTGQELAKLLNESKLSLSPE